MQHTCTHALDRARQCSGHTAALKRLISNLRVSDWCNASSMGTSMCRFIRVVLVVDTASAVLCSRGRVASMRWQQRSSHVCCCWGWRQGQEGGREAEERAVVMPLYAVMYVAKWSTWLLVCTRHTMLH